MAVKTKDYTVNLTDFTEDGKLINANKKTAIRIDGLTQANVETLSFVYDENKQLVITNTDNNTKLIVSNPSAIKYIKTDYVKNGKKETYNLTDIISNNLVDNLTMVAYNKKKKAYIGTNYNDTFTGTEANETFTGGLGKNLIYYIKGFGNDVINLTKNEKLTLDISGINGINSLRFEYNKKDLRIYTDKNDTSSSAEFITLKNFASKDVTGANGSVEIKIGSEIYDLRSNQKEGEYWCEIVPKGNFTGGWMNDHINAKSTAEIIKKGKHVDLVLNGGKGNDIIESSMFADKITGGVGRNTVKYTSLTQLDGDKITLTKGENLIIDVSEITQNPNNISYTVSGKNLVVTVADGDETKNFTIMNFGTKDVTNNKTKKSADTSSVELKLSNSVTVDLRNEIQVTASSGTWHNDLIDKSDYKIYKDKKKTIVQTDTSKKGLTINGAAGNDEIIGTNYSDTIKGGAGDDTITAGKGNDKLYGEAGKNTFIFNTGDGNDTIYQGKGEDTLQFNDIELSTLVMEQGTGKNKKDLIIRYGDNDSVTVKNYYTVNKKGKITGVNKKNSVKNITANDANIVMGTSAAETFDGTDDRDIIYANGGNDVINPNIGDDVIYIGKGNTTLKINASMQLYDEGFVGWADNFKKTIYLQDKDSVLTIDFDKDLNSGGRYNGVFCRGSGLDRDLYISVDGGTSWCIRVKDYFDEEGNPKTDSVKLNIWDVAGETQTTYTVPEWANGSYWGRTFEIQPFGTYNAAIHGTNMPFEEIRTAYGNHDDVVYAGDGNDDIYVYGGHNKVYTGEGKKYISMLGAQSQNEIYIGSDKTTETTITMTGINNVTSASVDATTGDLNIAWTALVSDDGDETYTSTARIDNWAGKTSQAKINMRGNERNNTLIAIDDVTNILDGVKGNDTLVGGTGDDTFNFDYSNGYGIDTIQNGSASDQITFESGHSLLTVDFDSFNYYKGADNLVIKTVDSNHEDNFLIIEDYFTEDSKINKITSNNFAAGTTGEMNLSDIDFTELPSFGLANNSVISGTADNDVLIGNTGTNTITGGAGNDSLYTYGGENTFVFNSGDGSDTLYQKGGDTTLKFNDVTIAELTNPNNLNRSVDDLLISYDGTNTLTVKNYFTADNTVTKITDSTGTTYNTADCIKNIISSTKFISGKGRAYHGTDGGDIIKASDNKPIYGNGGSDIIFGCSSTLGIYTYTMNFDTEFDTKDGVVDEVHAGNHDNDIFGNSATNILYGDGGNDQYVIYNNLRNIISDSNGTGDYLNIQDTDYTDMHFVFNVDSQGNVDSDGLRILSDSDYAKWQVNTSDSTIKGTSVVKASDGTGGWNCIESFMDKTVYSISMTQINSVKNEIASWLSDECYGSVAGVFGNALEKSAEDSAADISTLVAKFDSIQTMWS